MRFERITINAKQMGRLPCIRGPAVIPVTTIVGLLAAGETHEQILAGYPDLEAGDILAALAFAAEAVQERELPPRRRVRLLIDQNLAACVAALLRDAGHDAVHGSERGMSAADDDRVLQLAVGEERVLVSEDTDLGAPAGPIGRGDAVSFVLIRSAERLTTEARTNLLVSTLPRVESELEAGAIVVLGRSRVRVSAAAAADD